MPYLPPIALGRFDVVAIGSSTGGPEIVERIIAALPPELPVPVLVAQHLPPSFTGMYAAQLSRAGALTAVEAETGMPVLPAAVYVGRGHQHMRVRRRAGQARASIEISPEPAALLYRPSADELFRSCAEVYGGRVLAVVLTGMGRDGTLGATAVRDAGGMVLTQSQATCAVWGMPRSCEEAGVSAASLDPPQIIEAILQLVPEHHRRPAVGATS
jgi:two-component system chemotaxis response regulator CheB